MTCNDCANFHLKADKKMAKQGYGGCKQREAGQYVAYSKPACGKFEEAPADIVAKRMAWMRGNK